MSQIGPGRIGAHRGQATLTAPVSLAPAVADTYEAVPGVWGDGNCHAFVTSAAGVVTYSGESGAVFLLNGTSDLGVAIADTTTFALFLNGTLVPGAETPHIFTAPAKTENISITALIELDSGDTVQVFAKSLAGNQLDIATLRITLWGGV
jgi:hypothetical protein